MSPAERKFSNMETGLTRAQCLAGPIHRGM